MKKQPFLWSQWRTDLYAGATVTFFTGIVDSISLFIRKQLKKYGKAGSISLTNNQVKI